MLPQQRPILEQLIAKPTRVRSQVHIERVLVPETLIAHLTSKRLLPCMNPHVHNGLILGHEPFSAEIAAVLVVSQVPGAVDVELLLALRGVAAH